MGALFNVLCRFKNRPAWLVALGVALLLLLYLLREWLWGLFLLYLGALVLLGLLGGMRLAQAILRKRCWKLHADPKGSGSAGHPPSRGIDVPPHTYKRPDPMIYSQFYLMSKGLAITWDNPDIQLFDAGGAAVPSHGLSAGTSYDIGARIWNGSTDAPAVNLLVRFFFLSFGAGTIRNYIGETYVDVPVKGSPLLPVEARMGWVTPPAGHYCIQVELNWIDDANGLNNLGQENVDIKKLNSPNATFVFALRNTSARPRQLALRADGYTIPAKDRCPDPQRPAADPGAARRDRYARHRPAAHAMPAGWTVDFPGGRELAMEPGEQRDVTVKITAVDGFVGTQAINVNALDGDELVGGVTLYVHD
ncbi:MAG: hypothetical protein H6R02_820 [Burkholderiaceae bacterium]|nr:hypothetical protein [Burkholderiaceae bacterium]